jgi:hypothetical protein
MYIRSEHINEDGIPKTGQEITAFTAKGEASLRIESYSLTGTPNPPSQSVFQRIISLFRNLFS